MSEYMVHVAIMQDCFNIMLRSTRCGDEIKRVIIENRDFGEAASTTMSGDMYTWRILDDIRTRWADRTPEDHLESKLAFVLGWVSHRAADRQMKPVFRALVDPDTRKAVGNECTLYDEAKIYVEYYMNRARDPYKDTMALLLSDSTAAAVDIEGMKALFNGMLKQAFMRMHTMKPNLQYDVAGIEAWIDNIHTLLQQFRINMELEAQIVAQPDPAKYQKYIVQSHFFDDADKLIIAAKKLRFGTPISNDDIDEALSADPASDYAIALKTALRYAQACNDFFTGAIDMDALKDALDIGKLGRDGKGV